MVPIILWVMLLKNSTIERISTDINARSGKAHTEAAKLVPLSTIAAQVVKKAYDEEKISFHH